MKAKSKQTLGRMGESIAVTHLQSLGFEILERNWRGKNGEIDVIARDGKTIVAVEVKTRSSLSFGAPLEAITREKYLRLQRLIYCWVKENNFGFVRVRLDAIGVLMNADLNDSKETFTIQHIRGVYDQYL